MLECLLGDDIPAEPVPVRRPGVCVTGVEAREDGVGTSTASHTGKTKVGLNLQKNEEKRTLESLIDLRMMRIGTYRNANHKISIQETQLETIISPARGFHDSSLVFAALLIISLNISWWHTRKRCILPSFPSDEFYRDPPQADYQEQETGKQ